MKDEENKILEEETVKELEKELNSNENFEDISFVESTEDGESLPAKDIVKKLREDIKKLQKEKEDYLTGWQRAKADYVNLQKEMDESRKKITELTKEKIINNIIPGLDSFEMAFSNKEAWEKVDENWRMGVSYIYTQIIKGLEDSGIEKIDQIGIPFDPYIHQSVEAIPTEKEADDHKVEKIIQIGFKTGDRVIRPAKVNIYQYKKE